MISPPSPLGDMVTCASALVLHMHSTLRRMSLTALVAIAAQFLDGPTLLAQDTTAVTGDPQQRMSLAADYGYVSFRGDIDPWRLASLSLSRRTARGSLIGRVNWANRFRASGLQGEIDAYPRVTRNTYVYLNAGYSKADIFPEWRFGGELFANLPAAWETSIGFRQLRFSGSPVTLYTGTVGRYLGNYWISARPFLRFKPSGNSFSTGLTARRYFADAEHFVGATVSYGSSPSDRVTPDAVERGNSFSAGIQGSTGISLRKLATWSLYRDREELENGRIRNSLAITLGVKLLF